MEIQANSKTAKAAVAFQGLTAANQDALIEMIKHLLSERGKYPAQQMSAGKTDE